MYKYILPLACAAFAACSSNDAPPLFQVADLDGNGSLSEPETSQFMVTALFAERDLNDDAMIDADEWRAGKQRYVDSSDAETFLSEYDLNQDGIASLEEAQQFATQERLFQGLHSEADLDGDGQLSPSEASSYYQQLLEQKSAKK